MRALSSLRIPEKLVQLKRPCVDGRRPDILGRSHLNEVDTNWHRLLGAGIFYYLPFVLFSTVEGWPFSAPVPEKTKAKRELSRVWRGWWVLGEEVEEGSLQRSTFIFPSAVGWAFLGSRRSDEFTSRYPVANREERPTCTHLLPPKPHLPKSLGHLLWL